MSRFEWIVSTKSPDGHPLKHLDRGTEVDMAQAIERAKDEAEKLRSSGVRDWYVGVIDTTKPTMSNNPPTYGEGEVIFLLES